eukprot:SAG31_NODE_150_length_22290_cov_5.975801_11_plen_69_part_00
MDSSLQALPEFHVLMAAQGTRTGVPAFYVSFLLAPIASNASELSGKHLKTSQKISKNFKLSQNISQPR